MNGVYKKVRSLFSLLSSMTLHTLLNGRSCADVQIEYGPLPQPDYPLPEDRFIVFALYIIRTLFIPAAVVIAFIVGLVLLIKRIKAKKKVKFPHP